MVTIRLVLPSRQEFQKEFYKPGVISLSRILWGSIGAGLLLITIGIFSQAFKVGVLYPPLAATCFINATCVYLRVARPKSVIVGHFFAAIGGLLGVFVGDMLFTGDLLIPMKLGLGVMFAAVFMQILDADHPPAAATAAIPALYPLIPPPCDDIVLPLHMAYGAVIAVIFAFVWNRWWFDWPVDDLNPIRSTWFSLNMERPDVIGTCVCISGFVLMCLKPWLEIGYQAGLLVMLVGITILSVHHFFTSNLITRSQD